MKCPSAPSTCACALAVTIAIPLWIPASAGRGPLQAPHGANGWTIEHIAGGGPDGLPADLANLNDPTRLAAGDDGEFYVVARGDKRVYRISPLGIIEPLAGSGADDMDGLLTEPVEVAHGGGTIFIGDVASRILSRDLSVAW